nr:MAG TPA: hypothetical protein [Caudoviricetes sp.]DAL85051.1 MAG TPA: hypothetical protein [Caudoviricetes sp.]
MLQLYVTYLQMSILFLQHCCIFILIYMLCCDMIKS